MRTARRKSYRPDTSSSGRPGSAASPTTWLLCASNQWLIIFLTGIVVAGFAWPWYAPVSGWIGLAVFLMTATFVHLIFTCGLMVSFPHVAILITGLQYLLAAWLSYYYPSANPTYNIGDRLPQYLPFASFVTIAVVLGWTAGLSGITPSRVSKTNSSPALLRELDGLFWFGLACCIASRLVGLGGLNFLFLLCANLRYVGALGRMLVDGPGWRWRIGLTLVMEVLFATQEGMFHSVLLWGASVLLVGFFKFRPGKAVILGLTSLGMLILPCLQEAKLALREELATHQAGSDIVVSGENVKNAMGLANNIGEGLLNTASGNWDQNFLGDTAVRYNQGWIINRIMLNVPASEPYARGETLVTAVKAALLPRILFPEKPKAGGQMNMERFAGVYLIDSTTSMNLGYAGEMYANFGYWGGIAGCFFYALSLGLFYRWVCSRASANGLWWAFVPFVGITGLKAEEGIAEVLNWIVKASVVTAVIYFICPAIRAALSRPRNAGQQNSRVTKFQRRRHSNAMSGVDDPPIKTSNAHSPLHPKP